MAIEINPPLTHEKSLTGVDRIEIDSPRVRYHIKSVFTSIAVMIGAYFLWAQNFGNSGFALFLVATALLMVWNLASEIHVGVNYTRVALFGAGMTVGCVRLVWQPNALVCLACVLHLLAIGLAMQGRTKGYFDLILFALQSIAGGVVRWTQMPWGRLLNGMSRNQLAWLSWGIPLLAGIAFLIPLIQSHPELAAAVLRNLSVLFDSSWHWMTHLNFLALLIVAIVGIWSLGVLLPCFGTMRATECVDSANGSGQACSQTAYFASRNTLIVVSCIFVWFLAVEIRATWFRQFPEGFIYSTYAHQGAAWLTVALGMSTIALSVLFRSEVHKHPQIMTLQRLAWFWSFCNVLLVIAVFYRLILYVNFNGLTRMRIIGFVGVACVFAGFAIVNFRILRQKSPVWILHKQVWAFLWSIYILALLPMDAIAHRWNEACIRSGMLAPAVQIAVHSISDEGLLCLLPLLDSENEEIRYGVTALLADRHASDLSAHPIESNSDWTQFHGSTQLLQYQLEQFFPKLEPFVLSNDMRRRAIERFRSWTMRWY